MSADCPGTEFAIIHTTEYEYESPVPVSHHREAYAAIAAEADRPRAHHRDRTAGGRRDRRRWTTSATPMTFFATRPRTPS